MMSRKTFSALILVAILFLTSESSAEVTNWGTPLTLPQRALLRLPDCETQPFVEADLVGTIRLELLSLGIEISRAESTDTTGYEALFSVESPTCQADEIFIRLRHLAHERETVRSLDLSDRPLSDRSRVLALTLSELLQARWAFLLTESPAETPEEQESRDNTMSADPAINEEALSRRIVEHVMTTLEERTEAERSHFCRVRLSLAIDLESLPQHDSGLLGGRLGIDVALSQSVPLHLALDAGYRRGGGIDQIGSVASQTFLGGLTARYQGGTERVMGGLGLRFELGWGWIEGNPTVEGYRSAQADGFLLSLAIDGMIALRLSSRIEMVLGMSAGWILVGLDTKTLDYHVGGVAGAFIIGSLGLAIRL